MRLYRGLDAEGQARAAAALLARDFGLDGVYAHQKRSGWVLAYGLYRAHDTAKAQAGLRRIRGLRHPAGEPVFPRAYLSPPSRTLEPSGEFDLRSVREAYGVVAALTLQIGVYEAASRSTAAQAAESAVAELRAKGELAFFYHGPNRSVVTVGVFDEHAYDMDTGRLTGAAAVLQSRFPHNLYNGQGVLERVQGASGRVLESLQPSALVQIP